MYRIVICECCTQLHIMWDAGKCHQQRLENTVSSQISFCSNQIISFLFARNILFCISALSALGVPRSFKRFTPKFSCTISSKLDSVDPLTSSQVGGSNLARIGAMEVSCVTPFTLGATVGPAQGNVAGILMGVTQITCSYTVHLGQENCWR